MRVVSLGSGSSGNVLLIEAGPHRRTKLLVDAGLSARLIQHRLRAVGVHPAQLQGVLVTHEHSDHVIGLSGLVKRYAIPIFADPRTHQALVEGINFGRWRTDSGRFVSSPLEEKFTGKLASPATGYFRSEEEDQNILADMQLPQTQPLSAGASCIIGDIKVTSFPISHDAIAPCGYLLEAGGCRVCIVTDSGEVTPTMLEKMQHADLLILESNHDRERLLRGPYAYHLKQRILSSTGHLSNDQAADAVLRIWRSDGIRWLWLSHLSRTNNTPSLALTSMRERLQSAGANLSQIHISASPPGMGSTWDSTLLWQTSALWEMER